MCAAAGALQQFEYFSFNRITHKVLGIIERAGPLKTLLFTLGAVEGNAGEIRIPPGTWRASENGLRIALFSGRDGDSSAAPQDGTVATSIGFFVH
jgi:hypothetical protein